MMLRSPASATPTDLIPGLVPGLILTVATCLSGCRDDTQADSTAAELTQRAEPTMTQKSEPAFDDAMLNSRIDTAKQDIAKQLAIDVSGVHVVTAEWVSWRTSALGCPKPDRGYLQVITPGVLIRLRAGEKIFRYHGSRNGDPFLCSAPGVPEDPAPGDPGGAHGQIDDGT